MRIPACLLAVTALGLSAPATARVVASSGHGFELVYSDIVAGPPRDALQAFADVSNWWDDAHTYSGSNENLSMELKPGGCFCERLPGGGGIEHLRVVSVDPGKRLVLSGALGPLLYEAVGGVMDVRFEPAGEGTKITLTYKAAGFANGGADTLAPVVDQVLGGLFSRYLVYATPAKPQG